MEKQSQTSSAIPSCNCPAFPAAIKFTVRKDGPNKGRAFYTASLLSPLPPFPPPLPLRPPSLLGDLPPPFPPSIRFFFAVLGEKVQVLSVD